MPITIRNIIEHPVIMYFMYDGLLMTGTWNEIGLLDDIELITLLFTFDCVWTVPLAIVIVNSA